MRLDLVLPYAALVAASLPSLDYCRANGIDYAATVPAAGGVHLAEVQPDGRHFEASKGGILAAWCDVVDEDAETVIDAAAWPVEQPEHWWTIGGMGAALGMAAAVNPATYSMGYPLRLFRSPLAWLQAGCDGACVLDRAAGARWLLALPPGRWAAQDQAHATDIAASMRELIDLGRIVVPRQPRAA